MLALEKLSFDQVQYAERCSLVSHGEILQTAHNGNTVLGMRTFYNDPMGGAEALLVIGGPDHAALISLDALGNAPALIVTKLVRLVATNILPFSPSHSANEIGNLLQEPEGAFIARSQVFLSPNGNTQPAFVYLTNGNPKSPAGTYFQTLSSVNLRGVARAFELELRPEPLKVIAAS